MLSNEEREAKLELSRYIYGKNLVKDDIVEYLCIIFALIKKQSKEIEELKANKGYHLGFIDGGIAKRYEYEDKIKAKIEEVKDGTYDAKIVLQSLLEKE